MTDKLHFMFLQLPFFNKTEVELVTPFDKWCFFLKNLETFDVIPNILNEPVFMKALDIAKIENMEAADYILYQISKSKKYDMELLRDEAKDEGREEGREEKEIRVVILAHSQGYTLQQISGFAEVSVERVLEIIEEYTQYKA